MKLEGLKFSELQKKLAEGEVSVESVAIHYLDRIQKLNPKLNAFISVNESLVDQARDLDKRLAGGEKPGPLFGVPVAVKDLLCTKKLRTTAGSRMLEAFQSPYESTVTDRLLKAGALIVGKTNLDEFAMGSSNETSFFGACKNPWNLDYVPGGSSGGSAAAVAADMAPLSIGTDTGGSVRQPASFCGVVGLKPTYGRVSRYGVVAFASSLDQVGVMGRDTRGCAEMLKVISGPDPLDGTTAQEQVPAHFIDEKFDVKTLRVGWPKEFFSGDIDPEITAAVTKVRKTLEDLGAQIKEVDLPSTPFAVPTYYMVATSEASSNLARYDGIRFGHRADFGGKTPGDLEEFYSRNRGEGFGTEVKRRIILGTYALSSGYYEAYYKKASQVRRKLRDEMISVFDEVDVLLTPVSATQPFKCGEKITDPISMYLNDVFTTSANLAGIPGISLPVGLSSKGLPLGVQFMAKHFNEQVLLNVGCELEKAGLVKSEVANGVR